MTTSTLRRRAVYLQIQLSNYVLRREYGIANLDEQIEVTRTLLLNAEARLNERGLFLRGDGEVVEMPRERDKRERVAV